MRHRRIGELSGGQKQRISLARILRLPQIYLYWMNRQREWMKNLVMNFIDYCVIVPMNMARQF